jgi:hypothetical protein
MSGNEPVSRTCSRPMGVGARLCSVVAVVLFWLNSFSRKSVKAYGHRWNFSTRGIIRRQYARGAHAHGHARGPLRPSPTRTIRHSVLVRAISKVVSLASSTTRMSSE